MHLYKENYKGVKLDEATSRQQRKSCRPKTTTVSVAQHGVLAQLYF